MQPMLSDIWATVQSARAWAAIDDIQRSMKIIEGINEYNCGEASRLVARTQAGRDNEELRSWFQTINRLDLKVFAMLGVLEQRWAD